MMFRYGKKLINSLILKLLTPVLLFLLLITSSVCVSEVLDVSLSQTVEQSSNFLRESDINGGEDLEETINTTVASIRYDKNISSLQSNVDYSISYLDFQNNKASDVTRNNLDFELNWIISRGFYSWYFSDTFTQTTIDANKISNEDNTQDVNEFVTGPKFEWRFNSSAVVLRSLLSNFDYSNTNNDNTSIDSGLTLEKKIPGGMNLSINYSTKFVSYDDSDVSNDYNQSTLGVNFQYTRGVDTLGVFVGETYHDNDSESTEFTSSSLTYNRRLSRVSSFSLEYSNRISDPSSDIDVYGTPLNGIIEEESSTLAYQKTSSGFVLDMRFNHKNRNDGDSDDVDLSEAKELSISRALGAVSQLSLSYNDTRRSVEVSGVSDYDDKTFTTSLAYLSRVSNKITLRVFASEVLAKSTDVLRQYKDTRVGVTFQISR